MVELMEIEIKRRIENEHGTFGELFKDGSLVAVTLERPWMNNQKDVSCIPAGEYVCKPHESPRFGFCYQVQDVPGRTDILFHKGNWLKETLGCVLVGRRWDHPNRPTMILESELGLRNFHQKVDGFPVFGLKVTG